MISLNNLKDFVLNFINTNNSSVIYFGIGSYYDAYKSNKNINNADIVYWKYNENQQFPPFLHDFKLKNIDIPILIVLIDPNFNSEPPYIVDFSNIFLENSWTTSKDFSNLYLSNFQISVIKISDYVMWDFDEINLNTNLYSNQNSCSNIQKTIDFEKIITELCIHVSEPTSNTLLFYHEFTGKNVISLEYLIKDKISNFNSNKICIDITRGSDLSCYFNLSNPEFYPIITFDSSSKLKYINPDLLNNFEKNKIINQHKKFTEKFYNKSDYVFSQFDENYLFQTPEEIILCFQIIKFDKISLNNILNGILPLIRYLYVCEDNNNINLKMWGIRHLLLIKKSNNVLTNVSDIIDKIIANIKLIMDINDNNDSIYTYGEYSENNINNIRQKIVDDLFCIMKDLLYSTLIKYEISHLKIDELIENLKILTNKYDIIPNYKTFIANLNI
jgi:hypothetical protein